ncbi:hypothetical protein HK105_208695 [Polyrhizophydium stewartii]|uniref:G protein-coupled receptor n=1 Tax=Polyrhizophydium stewartii TaxID=2732419 RepID=A0ABR4MX80_9FUNG
MPDAQEKTTSRAYHFTSISVADMRAQPELTIGLIFNIVSVLISFVIALRYTQKVVKNRVLSPVVVYLITVSAVAAIYNILHIVVVHVSDSLFFYVLRNCIGEISVLLLTLTSLEIYSVYSVIMSDSGISARIGAMRIGLFIAHFVCCFGVYIDGLFEEINKIATPWLMIPVVLYVCVVATFSTGIDYVIIRAYKVRITDRQRLSGQMAQQANRDYRRIVFLVMLCYMLMLISGVAYMFANLHAPLNIDIKRAAMLHSCMVGLYSLFQVGQAALFDLIRSNQAKGMSARSTGGQPSTFTSASAFGKSPDPKTECLPISPPPGKIIRSVKSSVPIDAFDVFEKKGSRLVSSMLDRQIKRALRDAARAACIRSLAITDPTHGDSLTLAYTIWTACAAVLMVPGAAAIWLDSARGVLVFAWFLVVHVSIRIAMLMRDSSGLVQGHGDSQDWVSVLLIVLSIYFVIALFALAATLRAELADSIEMLQQQQQHHTQAQSIDPLPAEYTPHAAQAAPPAPQPRTHRRVRSWIRRFIAPRSQSPPLVHPVPHPHPHPPTHPDPHPHPHPCTNGSSRERSHDLCAEDGQDLELVRIDMGSGQVAVIPGGRGDRAGIRPPTPGGAARLAAAVDLFPPPYEPVVGQGAGGGGVVEDDASNQRADRTEPSPAEHIIIATGHRKP